MPSEAPGYKRAERSHRRNKAAITAVVRERASTHEHAMRELGAQVMLLLRRLVLLLLLLLLVLTLFLLQISGKRREWERKQSKANAKVHTSIL